MLKVPIQVLEHGDGLALPAFQTAGSAGADLRAALTHSVILEAGSRVLIPCGFCMALPHGYEAQVRPRSGMAIRHGVTVVNAPGTIDSDYRGEVKVGLINLGQDAFTIERGDRIAQVVIAKVNQVTFDPVTALDTTGRGSGGFGSTGQG